MTWTWLLGLDFGIRDRCAATVAGWRDHDPCVYFPKSYRFAATPSECGVEVRKLQADYDFVRTVGDTGGMGLAFVAEMASRFQIHVHPAKKADKLGAIRIFNGELRSGRIKVVRDGCADLLEEWRSLPWNADGTREAEGFDADASDSALYAFMAARAYLEEPVPAAKTRVQVQAEEQESLLRAREEAMQRKASGQWWER